MAQQLKPCGTASAYTRHLRRSEEPCQPCRDAHNAYMKSNSRNRATGRARQRAFRRLAYAYSADFEAMFAEEFAKALAEEEAGAS